VALARSTSSRESLVSAESGLRSALVTAPWFATSWGRQVGSDQGWLIRLWSNCRFGLIGWRCGSGCHAPASATKGERRGLIMEGLPYLESLWSTPNETADRAPHGSHR
jgi:hypothetical protein